jgi:hypothetical protein
MLDLGTADDYAVVALGTGLTLKINSGPNIGDFLLGNGVQADFSGGGNGAIIGTVFYDSTFTDQAEFDDLQHPVTSSQLVADSVTAAALQSAQDVSLYAEGLAATQLFDAGTGVVIGNGGINVLEFANYNGPITLTGTASDYFVFNVSGTYNTNDVMTLVGVTPSQILFNFLGTSGNVFQTAGGNLSFGTYLATRGGNFTFSNLDLQGSLINTAGNISIVSGSQVESTPELSSLSAAGVVTCLGYLISRRRKRAKAA